MKMNNNEKRRAKLKTSFSPNSHSAAKETKEWILGDTAGTTPPNSAEAPGKSPN